MKTYGCALCSVKRPAGALYIVKPLAGGPRLICWWCVESVGKMVKESPQDRRKGEAGKAYWCKVD